MFRAREHLTSGDFRKEGIQESTLGQGGGVGK